MYRQCTTNRTISRQRELEAGILEILLHRHFENLSVVDLCNYMNIPRKAFYRYFSSKEGALYALIDHTLIDALKAFFQFQNSTSDPREVLAAFFKFWLDKKNLLDALAYNDLSGVLLQRAISYSVSTAALSGTIFPAHDEDSREYITVFFISGIMSLVIQWHHEKFDKSPREMAETAVRFIYHPELTLR
ncbi:MAG: TetR/AcrR family transcriptional regulator [Firmicutes bacterium]|nr:TetR/AcrR family transcriptional regulator [Bacillota bacterium]